MKKASVALLVIIALMLTISLVSCGGAIGGESVHSHTAGDVVKENEIASTCASEGSYDEVRYCTDSSCNKELSREKKTTPKLDHNYIGPFCIVCQAEIIGSEGLEYELIGNAAVVTGIGTCTDSRLVIPYYTELYAEKGEIVCPVIGIAEMAFYNCETIEEIVMPSISDIGPSAFSFCENLKKITFGQSLKIIPGGAFAGCSSLTNVTIPDGVIEIGPFAFAQTSIKSITIPESVAFIGEVAFWTPFLEEIVLEGENMEYVVSKAMLLSKDGKNLLQYIAASPEAEENVVIPASVEKIYRNAFCLSKVKTIAFEENSSLKSIGELAFTLATSLKSISLPYGLETIGNGAFSTCDSLSNVTIPESVSYIGPGAFTYCTSLRSITVPEGIVSLSGTFAYCTNLKEVNLPDSLEILSGTFTLCSNLTSITLPANLRKISEDTFEGCQKLSSVIFKNSDGWETYYWVEDSSMEYGGYSETEQLSASTISNYTTAAELLRGGAESMKGPWEAPERPIYRTCAFCSEMNDTNTAEKNYDTYGIHWICSGCDKVNYYCPTCNRHVDSSLIKPSDSDLNYWKCYLCEDSWYRFKNNAKFCSHCDGEFWYDDGELRWRSDNNGYGYICEFCYELNYNCPHCSGSTTAEEWEYFDDETGYGWICLSCNEKIYLEEYSNESDEPIEIVVPT